MSSKYEIQQSIGIGSFGQVFRARGKDNKHYVIKKIKMKDSTSPEKKIIENEVKLLQQFQHINIVGYKDFFMDKEGNINIVMEHCEGGDLYNKIRSTIGRRFDESQIIDWFVQICLAIHYLHQRRILHRDLKTQNIFLTGAKVRLGDFGISKVLDEKRELTSTVIGTPYYMSPEQFRYKPYSYKTDIWALGCMLYEMCNLSHAFDAQNINALAMKVLKGNHPPVHSQYSKPLRDLVTKLLSINPRDRPTIVEILKTPVLRKRLMSYIQTCLKFQKHDDIRLDTLKKQAQTLGLEFIESVPRELQPISAPVTENIRTERAQQTERHSARVSHKSSKEILDRKALQNRKKMLEKELQQQQHEKNRLQEENKRAAEKRQQILQREKERRKKIISDEKVRSSSSPNLALMKKNKARGSVNSRTNITNITNISTQLTNYNKSQRSETQEQQPLAAQCKSIPLRPKEPAIEAPVKSVIESHPISKSKVFKMEEEYDMNFDREGSQAEQKQQKQQTIYEILELEQQEVPKPKHSIIPEQIGNSIPVPEDMAEVMSMVNAVNVASQKIKLKTIRIKELQTQLLQIDFEVSEDSIEQEVKRPVNPKYQRVQEKIAQLKSRIESGIGKKKHDLLLQKVLNSQKENTSPNGHLLKQSVANTIGLSNMGYWHLANQVVVLEQSLKMIPQFN